VGHYFPPLLELLPSLFIFIKRTNFLRLAYFEQPHPFYNIQIKPQKPIHQFFKSNVLIKRKKYLKGILLSSTFVVT
jgi:hypothetical protein